MKRLRLLATVLSVAFSFAAFAADDSSSVQWLGSCPDSAVLLEGAATALNEPTRPEGARATCPESDALLSATLGTTALPDGGAVWWSQTLSRASFDHLIVFRDPSGMPVRSIGLSAMPFDGGLLRTFTIRYQDLEVTVNPSSETAPDKLREFFGWLSGTDLQSWIDQSLTVLPLDSSARTVLSVISDGLGVSSVPSSFSDCYEECVEDERSRCQTSCGSTKYYDPCVSICYVAIAVGCSIGCL